MASECVVSKVAPSQASAVERTADGGAGQNDPRLLLLSPADNVLVVTRQLLEGETVLVSGMSVLFEKTIPLGHKVARRVISEGEKIRKYGAPIGSATRSIEVGEHVHIHNMKSDYTKTHVISGPGEPQ